MDRPFIIYNFFVCGIIGRKGGNILDNIMTFINEVGFPIVVSLYLLYRIETKLEAVIQSIQSLPDRLKSNE